MLLEVPQRFQVDNLVDEVVEELFQMNPHPVLTKLGARQIDDELGNHHIDILVVRSNPHFMPNKYLLVIHKSSEKNRKLYVK